MKLVHYSQKPLGTIRSKQQEGRITSYAKPWGLWVSVEGEGSYGWKEWCEAEEFGAERFVHAAEIILSPTTNILYLETPQAIEEFTETYGVLDPIIGHILDSKAINWPIVAENYQGIIIAPYQWSKRMARDTFWYYGWDCASGCIWDADAIQSVLQEPERMIREDHECV